MQGLLLLLPEHPLLYCKLLLDDLGSLILLQEFLQGLEVKVFGDGENAEEEVIVQENHSLIVLHNWRQMGLYVGEVES